MESTDHNDITVYPDGYEYIKDELLPVPEEAKENFMRTIILFLIQN